MFNKAIAKLKVMLYASQAEYVDKNVVVRLERNETATLQPTSRIVGRVYSDGVRVYFDKPYMLVEGRLVNIK